MNRFDYVRPRSVAEAIAAAAIPGSAYLAAGTNLLDLMKIGVARPARLIDLNHLPELDIIEQMPNGDVRVGAQVRNADLAQDPDFRQRFPAVAEALLSGASAQLRNAATVGGNLLQRTRCAWFQDTASACNRREAGSGCDARGGENRLHAVLGWSEHCIATHPSDFCVPLAALGAVVELEGPQGRREIPLEDFHLLPGTTPERESVLQRGELVVALRLPAAAAGFAAHARYIKLRSAPPTPSRWSPPPPRCGWRMAVSSRRGWRSAASPPSPGAPRPPRPRWPAQRRMPRRSGARRRSRWRRHGPPATTPSRSRWRGASRCAR
jgi:xanthine dehydrogenase YagS FAD-binding subunit